MGKYCTINGLKKSYHIVPVHAETNSIRNSDSIRFSREQESEDNKILEEIHSDIIPQEEEGLFSEKDLLFAEASDVMANAILSAVSYNNIHLNTTSEKILCEAPKNILYSLSKKHASSSMPAMYHKFQQTMETKKQKTIFWKSLRSMESYDHNKNEDRCFMNSVDVEDVSACPQDIADHLQHKILNAFLKKSEKSGKPISVSVRKSLLLGIGLLAIAQTLQNKSMA
jgi:hypothetical protein